MHGRDIDICVNADRLQDLSASRSSEWLVTNGRGGFAMGTVSQMLTRRYHGLLVAAVKPPVERFVLLAKLDATLTVEGLTYELATNDYPEAVHPQGFRLLESFSLRPVPTWRWRLGGAVVEQQVWMVEGEDSTFSQYRLLEGPSAVNISVRPLCTSRHFHHLTCYQDMGPPTVSAEQDTLAFNWSGGRPAWQMSHNGSFKSRPDWYYHFILGEEAARGYDARQDLFMPGVISGELKRGDSTGMVIAASTGPRSWSSWSKSRSELIESRPATESPNDPLAQSLIRAAADFVVCGGEGRRTVIAGYPWFGDWGRDTFISLPGLCLVTGRLRDARNIIESFSQFVDGGMIPNCFSDYGAPPEYNTVDASLWYIHALDRYLSYSGDWEFIVDRMYAVVAEMIEAHEKGTRHGIGLREDGLLAAGEAGFALTWMDARVNMTPVTPRTGKPVEINALWYNALRIASTFAARMGDSSRAEKWSATAVRCAETFERRFWNASRGCLFDVVDCDHQPDSTDPSVRPNQLLAISLTHPVLQRHHWRDVVDNCQSQLWTPVGLRTLSSSDPAYRAHYSGDTVARDSAYHEGTVWPWLLGPFVTSYVKAYGNQEHVHATARRFLKGLEAHLLEAGLGSVSEVADGSAPHRPGGCPWQAWSVAEPLRALCEDVLGFGPASPPSQPKKGLQLTAAPQ